MTDAEKLMRSIEPKSDQLNAEDLLCGPITVTIDGVFLADSDQQPVTIGLIGHKPYKPCKTMRRMLVVLWGANAVDWIGRSLTLFCDPNVKWGGQAVGGIRISHMSNISEPVTMMLSETKGKRKPVTVYPLVVASAESSHADDPEPTLLDEWRPKFAGAPDEVMVIAKAIAKAWIDRESLALESGPITEDIEAGWLEWLEAFRLAVIADLTK